MIATKENLETAQALPQFACHKIVRAAVISAINAADGASVELSLDGGAVGWTVKVTQEWYAKHQPQPGGYFVVYAAPPGEEPYASFSPAKPFEEGYVPIIEQGRYVNPNAVAIERREV